MTAQENPSPPISVKAIHTEYDDVEPAGSASPGEPTLQPSYPMTCLHDRVMPRLKESGVTVEDLIALLLQTAFDNPRVLMVQSLERPEPRLTCASVARERYNPPGMGHDEQPKRSQSEVFGTVAQWDDTKDRLEIRVGATVVEQLKSMLQSRLAEGEMVAVYGKGTGIAFAPGPANGWRVDDSLLVVSLTEMTAAVLGGQLEPNRGKYECDEFPELTIHVVPIEIKDSDGDVIKTVG